MIKVIPTCLLFITFIFTQSSFSQVGVNTTNPDPSTALDVNGNVRVRSLSSGAVYSDADGDLTNSGPQIIQQALFKVMVLQLKFMVPPLQELTKVIIK
ncbi:hypothetical protein INR76_10065 [Marixanthomonas sp. SCSIO 43207]|uniref:hypothetical protein n=1 Tax=Marixanthomonas sp. SCSIO 43207 TaxID=2779360 RepID=UPI001CA95404|nr:hypothetical protein [Marixanthomonas sp. SCSIO 43207]UAB80459.1 hypothetical protein INR76_10065 [Marixanthomonas sp. SCSIO 43207]